MTNGIVIQNDCLQAMQQMPSCSVDLVVTDPPYGYSFMGKDWDKAVPSVAVWKECLRVMKDGAFAFVMSAPRQDVLSQMIVRMTEAGFDMSYTSIYWTYSSGFPKAHNIGKAVDKMKGAKREVVGKKTGGAYSCENNLGMGEYGKLGDRKLPERNDAIADITLPSTPEAKALEGSYGGFQPKPAVEVIIVAMKPMTEKTFASQALANGHGITWLDDCRIPYAGEKNMTAERYKSSVILNWSRNEVVSIEEAKERGATEYQDNKQQGRFPANLLVSDNVLDDGVERKSTPFGNPTTMPHPTCWGTTHRKAVVPQINDKGSYSRYFDLDAFFKRLADTYPILHVSESLDAAHEICPVNNNEYISHEHDVQQLFHNLNKVGGWVSSYSSFCKNLLSSGELCVENWKALQDFLVGCPSDFHLDDELSHLYEGVSQEYVQLLNDVHKQCHTFFLGLDDKSHDNGYSYSFFLSCIILPTIIKIGRNVKLNLNELPDNVKKVFPFLIVPKASKREKNMGCEKLEDKTNISLGANQHRCHKCEKLRVCGSGNVCQCEDPEWYMPVQKNNHPTVKPLKLMSYLITLGSRPNDVILDPFAGSGTTLVAAKKLGRRFIGIEMSAEYCHIIEERLSAVELPASMSLAE